MLKFIIRFKTKAQVEIWHWKWDVLECKEDEDVSEYAIRFKRIYKRIDPYKSIPNRIIIRKFINSLFPKFVKFLTIIRPVNLDKAIEVTLDVETSQKVKAQKQDQAYIMDTIEELWREVHNLQTLAVKLK